MTEAVAVRATWGQWPRGWTGTGCNQRSGPYWDLEVMGLIHVISYRAENLPASCHLGVGDFILKSLSGPLFSATFVPLEKVSRTLDIRFGRESQVKVFLSQGCLFCSAGLRVLRPPPAH